MALYCPEDEDSTFLRNVSKFEQTIRRHIPEDFNVHD